MRKFRSLILTLGVLLVAAGPASADVIYLASGGVVKGKIVSENARELVVKTLRGSTAVIPRDDVDRIERGASPEAIYQEQLASLKNKRDPEAHYALGLWAKSINADEIAKKEFEKTIELDTNHKFARVELGYVWRDDQWVMPEAEVEVAPVEKQRRDFKLATPVSPELLKALEKIRSKELETRAEAWQVVGDPSAEVQRMLALLETTSVPADRLRAAVVKHVPAADGVTGKALQPHLQEYLSLAANPALNEALHSYGQWARRGYERNARRIRDLIKDWKVGSDGPAREKRDEALQKWIETRDAAVRVIFDLSIYPDANHGRSGQATVDEYVDNVRPAWEKFDELIKKDLAKLLAMTPEEANEQVDALWRFHTRLNEAGACLSSAAFASGELDELERIEPVYEILLAYRAGYLQQALARAGELKGYEWELLRRLRDERALAYNEGFKAKNPHDYGVKPSGPEVEQVQITNEYRMMMGRYALEIDPRLVESARGHSQDMTRLGFFAHGSPIPEKANPTLRMAKAGYTGGGGENISLGSTSPMATHVAWYNSSGHHRNILGETYGCMGSGKDGKHWTQNFGMRGSFQR